MKKILILNGAGRKNGNTAAMIQAFSEAAIANGNQIREFYLQNMNIHECMNCQGCRRKPKDSDLPCVQNDDMNEIYAAFKEADVIVFASPVYFWDITGTLKTVVDRFYAILNNSGLVAYPKESVLLMTSGGSTIEHTLDWYQNFESWLGWINLGSVMNDPEEAARIGGNIR